MTQITHLYINEHTSSISFVKELLAFFTALILRQSALSRLIVIMPTQLEYLILEIIGAALVLLNIHLHLSALRCILSYYSE